MTPKKESTGCPDPDCSAREMSNAVTTSLTETNRVLTLEMKKIQSLQEDHRSLQQQNLEALKEQTKHDILLERMLKSEEKQDEINDKLFNELRDLYSRKVEAMEFHTIVKELRGDMREDFASFRKSVQWSIGIGISIYAIITTVVALLK